MKSTIAFAITTFLLASYSKENLIDKQGSLVFRTVEQDLSLPSIAENSIQLLSEINGNKDSAMVAFFHGGPGVDYRNGLKVKQLVTAGYYVEFLNK